MSLKIDGGLFKYEIIDYHAVLCVPVDADAKEVRKRYLKIARRLHPDSSAIANSPEKDIANDLLSKLVNPAYEKLSVERNRAEYTLVLSQIGKRLAQESAQIELSTEAAKQLAIAPNVDLLYKNAIAKIAETQFNQLKQVPQFIAQISELNLVYLMRRAGKIMTTSPVVQAATSTTAPPPPPPPPSPPKEDSVVEQYLRRAQTLIKNNQFVPAKVELQDALKLEPKNSRAHSLMAILYMRQNQLKMARIHFDNALKLDPHDPIALEWKPKVDKVLGTQSGTTQVKKSADSEDPQPDNSSGNGGLFGGLFGGKKK
ncbi:J domain-containing protein [Sphaerospermopsis aphanizomenoides BCCUSP55]|uniref:J domain-containing protein n=1 Tax=Sphaerospermopsis aphanizomenoides TaxID=459663 RepID=UPI0019049725|nr:J domain-containing protein [Sphaerospermopsis aphanizomenoides]MBK1988186.1 J domain-containing protein [Sphaerospermopsis aphanizomenoides BCCUSP55]